MPTSVTGLVTEAPAICTCPDVALINPAPIIRSVVLPQPLGPTIEMNSDSPTSTLTGPRASTPPGPVPEVCLQHRVHRVGRAPNRILPRLDRGGDEATDKIRLLIDQVLLGNQSVG